MNRNPTAAGRLDSTEEFLGATPAVDAGKLQMGDLDVDPAALADVDGFGDCILDGVRLIANMR
jgi:hypothetical protein